MSDEARYEVFQRSKMTGAEETSARLADKARRLLESAMADTAAGKKHKWATGREKWEALQLEGQKAAGIVGKGRGRPRLQPPTPIDLLEKLLDRLTRYTEFKLSGKYTDRQLVGEVGVLQRLAAEVRSAGAMDDEVEALVTVTLGPLATSEP